MRRRDFASKIEVKRRGRAGASWAGRTQNSAGLHTLFSRVLLLPRARSLATGQPCAAGGGYAGKRVARSSELDQAARGRAPKLGEV